MPDLPSLQTMFALLGKLSALAGAIWAAFHFLPKQWLQHRFDEQLERQRAEHAVELQQARHRLDVALRQTSKLHEKEFDVLGEVWEKLNEALGRVAVLVSTFQSFPDLDRLDQARFEDFVDSCQFEAADKRELLESEPKERNAFYQKRIFWYKLRDAKQACTELHRAVQRNSIFFEPAIRERFLKIDAAAWRVLTTREIGEEAGERKMWRDAGQAFTDEITPLKDEIERLVQKRLGYEVKVG